MHADVVFNEPRVGGPWTLGPTLVRPWTVDTQWTKKNLIPGTGSPFYSLIPFLPSHPPLSIFLRPIIIFNLFALIRSLKLSRSAKPRYPSSIVFSVLSFPPILWFQSNFVFNIICFFILWFIKSFVCSSVN